MIKRIALALALGLSAAGSAFAADPPKDTASCMEQAFELATAAQGKKLSEAKLGEIEGMLASMEDQCASSDFAGAAKSQDEITAVIGK